MKRANWFVLGGGLLFLLACCLLSPAFGDSRPENWPAIESSWHLHDIGIAMHKYYDQFGHFPPRAVRDKDGNPLYSWRVVLLPFLGEGEEEKLYKEFKLD